MLIGFARKDKSAKGADAQVAPGGEVHQEPMVKKADASDLRISTGFVATPTQIDVYLKTHLERAPTKAAPIHTRRNERIS